MVTNLKFLQIFENVLLVLEHLEESVAVVPDC